MEDLRHAENRRDQAEPYTAAASPTCGFDEGRQPEPTTAVDRGGAGRDEPVGCCQDRRHGPADAAGLGAPFQRAAQGSAGLKDNRRRGNPRRLSSAQQTELAQIVETGPDRAVDGVVRWRRVDLQRVIEERFGVAYHERTIGKLLKALGFSHISARPRHPKQDGEVVEAFKKTSRARSLPISRA
jgi:transposase